MTNIEPQKTDVPEKIRTRLLSRFCFYLGLTVFVLAVTINIGFYVNCDTIPGDATNPYPIVGKIVVIMGYCAFLAPIGLAIGFFAIILAFFRQPRLRNFLIASAGFLLAVAAGHILGSGLERIRNSSASDLTHLSRDLKEYAEKHTDQLPTTNWCDDLLSFQSDRISYLKGILQKNSESLIGYGMNNNAGGKKLTDLPPDTVVLFETEPAKNPAGGPELMTTKKHFSKGCFVLFANNQIKFVRPEDFNNLRWKP